MWRIPRVKKGRGSPKTVAKRLKLLTWNDTLKCFTFNIPPGMTCLAASELCYEICYGKKGRWILPSNRRALKRRYQATKCLQHFKLTMIRDLMIIRRYGYNLVRYHSNGDFYSQEYFNTWLDIARCNSDITFFGYTKNWRIQSWHDTLLQAATVPNFYLNQSWDFSMAEFPSLPFPITITTYDWSAVTCLKQTKAGESCASCKRCFNRNVEQQVLHVH